MEQLKFSNRFLYPKLSNYDGLVGKILVASPSVYLGLEIEAEKVRNRYHQSYIPGSWNMIQDGSLKDEGSEFVTVPIHFQYIEMELRRLFAAVPLAHFSPRTSIHVHMNSRDFTNVELKKFLILYLIFERNLYRFSGDRWLNNFCMPLHGNPQMVISLLKTLDKNDFDCFSWCKYYGLNLLPLIGESGSSERIGTVEFRHMIGNKDVEYIMSWCNLILRLKLAAKQLPEKEIYDALIFNQTHSHDFIHRVFLNWGYNISYPAKEVTELIKESTLGTKVICTQARIFS